LMPPRRRASPDLRYHARIQVKTVFGRERHWNLKNRALAGSLQVRSCLPKEETKWGDMVPVAAGIFRGNIYGERDIPLGWQVFQRPRTTMRTRIRTRGRRGIHFLYGRRPDEYFWFWLWDRSAFTVTIPNIRRANHHKADGCARSPNTWSLPDQVPLDKKPHDFPGSVLIRAPGERSRRRLTAISRNSAGSSWKMPFSRKHTYNYMGDIVRLCNV
jgi:hypothetical protein